MFACIALVENPGECDRSLEKVDVWFLLDITGFDTETPPRGVLFSFAQSPEGGGNISLAKPADFTAPPHFLHSKGCF